MKDHTFTYEFRWKTCRDKPLLEDADILATFQKALEKLSKKEKLIIRGVFVPVGGNQVRVRVTTSDDKLSPGSLSHLLRTTTASAMRHKHKHLYKIPSVWRRDVAIRTLGKVEEDSD